MQYLLMTAVLSGICLIQPVQAWVEDDPFGEGASWEGVRMMGKPGAKKVRQEFTLVVTKRSRNQFEGELIIPMSGDGNEFRVKVTGTAPVKGSGLIRFRSERKGNFQQEFIGRLNNGSIGGSFLGRDVFGNRIEARSVKMDPKR